MLKNLLKKRNQSGFTIIEVMIVLAIAGLILVVVLIAVPQLQRNQRNSARKADAARVASTVGNLVANKNGAAYVNADEGNLRNELGSLSQYEVVDATFSVNTGTVTAIDNPSTMVIVTGAKCSGGGSTAVAGRSFVILYATENSSSDNDSGGTGVCIES